MRANGQLRFIPMFLSRLPRFLAALSLVFLLAGCASDGSGANLKVVAPTP